MDTKTELFTVVGEVVVTLTSPCRECAVEQAEEWGMCGSCIHDALRSGWIPGETGSN